MLWTKQKYLALLDRSRFPPSKGLYRARTRNIKRLPGAQTLHLEPNSHARLYLGHLTRVHSLREIRRSINPHRRYVHLNTEQTLDKPVGTSNENLSDVIDKFPLSCLRCTYTLHHPNRPTFTHLLQRWTNKPSIHLNTSYREQFLPEWWAISSKLRSARAGECYVLNLRAQIGPASIQ